jgi:hypothetical protein
LYFAVLVGVSAGGVYHREHNDIDPQLLTSLLIAKVALVMFTVVAITHVSSYESIYESEHPYKIDALGDRTNPRDRLSFWRGIFWFIEVFAIVGVNFASYTINTIVTHVRHHKQSNRADQ